MFRPRLKTAIAALGVGLFSIFSLYGQARVSVQPRPKAVLLEEYTGKGCGNCPDGAAMAAQLKALRGERLQVVAIHAGHYAEPTGGADTFDLRTAYSDSLLAQAGEYGYPQGTVDRVDMPDYGRGIMAMGRGYWTKAIKARSFDTATVNLWIGASLAADSRTLSVTVEGYYYRSAESRVNRLNVALLQNHIPGPQNQGGDDYLHEHVLRDLLTGLWGDSLMETTAGARFEKTYTYTVPADYRDVPVDLRHLEIVAFVCEDTKTVLQVTACKPALSGVFDPVGAKLSLSAVANRSIARLFEAEVENTGSDTIRMLAYEAVVNDTAGAYELNVAIPPYEKRTVWFGVNPYEPLERNAAGIRLTHVNGMAIEGNRETLTFNGPVGCVSPLSVELKTDLCPDEVSWYVADAAGNRICEYGPYAGSEAVSVTETLALEEGLYMLCFADSWWDGWQERPKGSFKVKDADGLLLGQNYDIKGKGEQLALRVGAGLQANETERHLPVADLRLYPIPAVGTATLQGVALADGTWHWRLTDLQGRLLRQGNLAVRRGEAFAVELSLETLKNGLYLISIEDGVHQNILKFTKNSSL